jgi:hypothetical protein
MFLWLVLLVTEKLPKPIKIALEEIIATGNIMGIKRKGMDNSKSC